MKNKYSLEEATGKADRQTAMLITRLNVYAASEDNAFMEAAIQHWDTAGWPSVQACYDHIATHFTAERMTPMKPREALQMLLEMANAEASSVLHSDEFTPERVAEICREALEHHKKGN